jgi:para-nitrobenzyl esterase
MSAPTPGLPVAQIGGGAVRGTATDGVAAFKGIPYPAPPVGDLRFAAPAPVAPWDGIRDATAYGPTPAKPYYLPPFDRLLSDPHIDGDDVLNLNVWTPADRVAGDGDGTLLPVLVWIHGGAFRGGTGAVGTYDGSAFARDGVVCVTINYRLGMDGFGLLPDAPDNRGLLDQIAALRWVRDEIAAFGGDSGRVTIAGESAGAMSSVTLMASAAARGLFHGVIAQSGAGHHVQPRESAERVAAELGRRLEVEPTAAGFAGVPIRDFIAAQLQLSQEVTSTDRAAWGALGLDGMPYEPVLDDAVIPQRPIDALQDAAVETDAVPLLIGTNSEEFRLWLVPLGLLPHVTADALPYAGDPYRLPAEGAAVYAAAPTPGDGLTAIMSDWAFRIPALRVAEARWGSAVDTHVYEFRWRSPCLDGELGAAHAVEIGFAFDTTANEASWGMIGPDAPKDLAAEMHAAWVAFATDGDPGWPAYEADRRTVRIFGGAEGPGALEDDPDGDRRVVWDGVR